MSKKEQFIDKNISETAGFVTYFRACSNKEKHKGFRGHDYLAKEFHIGSAGVKLKLSPVLLPMLKIMLPGTYEWVVSRTFFFDDVFKKCLDENYNQIVILGAGFDSKAYRFINLIKETCLFEVDVAPTQKIKREILETKNIRIPQKLKFVSINFNRDDLGNVLPEAGFKKNRLNCFFLEGVTEYLTEEAVNSTFSFIQKNSRKGSLFAFTYIFKEVVEGNYNYYGSKQVAKMVSKHGEPFQFGIKEGEIDKFLAKRGFRLITNYNAEELEKKYLTNDKGRLYGKVCGHQCVTLARVH